MRDLYAIVVAIAAATHFAFVGYGLFGGFLALRWPRTIWCHVSVVIWCVAIELIDFVCPLTWLERWARLRAGMTPLSPSGFLDHYITGTWYPTNLQYPVLALVLVLVLVSWTLFALRPGRRRSAADGTPDLGVGSARRNVQ